MFLCFKKLSTEKSCESIEDVENELYRPNEGQMCTLDSEGTWKESCQKYLFFLP